jgi:ABC-2 type transport system ATP-binding protein
MTLAIETKQLTRYFDDVHAVNSVDLTVERGSMYGFLGPNGAGKSTTIKMLTGILVPSSGEITLLGKNPWNRDDSMEIKQQTGVVPEDLALFDNLTAREYLTFTGRMYSMDLSTIRDRTEELLSLLKLEQVERKLTVEYSHGMKKKLALAAALLPNPDLLFLDEPFEGVDAVTSRVIRNLLSIYVRRGSTVFITSHVLEIVERICTHVGIIANGELVEQTSLEELRQGSSLEQRFLEKVGRPDEEAINLAWLEDGPVRADASLPVDSADASTEEPAS